MNAIQTTLLYLALSCGIVSLLWVCVRALRKRFAGEPCYPTPSKRVCVQGAGEPHLPDCRCSPPSEEDLLPLMEQLERKQAATFPAYIKGLSDEDLWTMKGLSAPLAKIRKTEMDVRRRRKTRAAAARRDVIGHTPDGRPVFVDHNGSPTLQDPLGWDANGSPAIEDNVQAALAE